MRNLALALIIMATFPLATVAFGKPNPQGSAVPLAGYAGRYPSEKLKSGHSFLTDARIKRAVEHAAPDEVIAFAVLQQGVAGPISLVRRHLIAGGCQPHSCDRHNWLIVLNMDSNKAVICYFNTQLTAGTARWFREFDRVSGPATCDEASAAKMIIDGF